MVTLGSAGYDHGDTTPSWSTIRGVLDCPAQARWASEQPREETAAMALGSMLHCATLEPGLLRQRYATPPEVVRLPGWEPIGRRGEGYCMAALPGRHWPRKEDALADARPWGWRSPEVPMPPAPDGSAPGFSREADARAALGALVSGTWTSPELLSLAERVGDEVRALLPGDTAILTEVGMRGRLEGIAARGCADVIIERAGGRLSVVDVKTVAQVDARSVARSAHAGRWHGQLATYAMLARQQERWRHVAVADVRLGVLIVQAPAVSDGGGVLRLAPRGQPRPHARLVWLDAEATAYAYAQARHAWRLWRDCVASGRWPDHAGGLEVAGWQERDVAGVEEVEAW